jgi:hypothetical protein
MHRISLRLLITGIAVTGLFLTACSENPIEPGTGRLVDAIHTANQTAGMNVIQSVTGNGHYVDGPVDRTATFSIRKYADERVDGWYRALGRGPGGANIRVRIECLHVVGNQAWASGTVVAAVNPDNIGRPYSIRFVDNGQGDGAAPDEIGVGRFVGSDCADEPDLSLRQLKMGNLQIRG